MSPLPHALLDTFLQHLIRSTRMKRSSFSSVYTNLHVQLQMTRGKKRNCKYNVQCQSTTRNISSMRGRKIANYLNKCHVSFNILYITVMFLYNKCRILGILHQWFRKHNLNYINRAEMLRTCIPEIPGSNFGWDADNVGRCCPESLRANSVILPRIKPQPILSTYYPIHFNNCSRTVC
jgi:hypothetical protein